MAKPQKTKEQIEALLMERCKELPIQSVTVSPSKAYGWEANFIALPHFVTKLIAPFDVIVQEVRGRFDLKG